MDITSPLDDGSTTHLLVLLVALTFFYATLLWLPFRGTTLLMRRFRQSLSRKTRDRKTSRLRSAGMLR